MKPGSLPYSTEAICLTQDFAKRLHLFPRHSGKVRVMHRATIERQFIAIELELINQKYRKPVDFPPLLWVDAITGQLYDPVSRRCISSDQLELVQ